LDVDYTKELKPILTRERELKRHYNKLASAIATRIKELQATSTLDDMRFLAGKIEELKGQRKGQFSIRLSANFRLIFEPNHDPVPTKADGGISWVAVTRVKILEVEDYH